MKQSESVQSKERNKTNVLPFTVVILGPTGSGKTAVSLTVAKHLQAHPVGGYSGAEIISADSRAIYCGMDIGTAKPTQAEQAAASHWGIDLVRPDQRFTVADWKQYTEQKIYEIKEREHLPMVVGGTGLYIDALIYDYSFTRSAQKNYTDRQTLRTSFLNIGVSTPKETLRNNLKQRIDKMFTQELFAETQQLVAAYGTKNAAFSADIYRFVWDYLQGKLTLSEAKARAFYADWHLARRQMTWFRRNPQIVWMLAAQIPDYIESVLNNLQADVNSGWLKKH